MGWPDQNPSMMKICHDLSQQWWWWLVIHEILNQPLFLVEFPVIGYVLTQMPNSCADFATSHVWLLESWLEIRSPLRNPIIGSRDWGVEALCSPLHVDAKYGIVQGIVLQLPSLAYTQQWTSTVGLPSTRASYYKTWPKHRHLKQMSSGHWRC